MRRRKRLPSQLAADLGISHVTVSRWLSGADVPSIKSCRRLAEYSGEPLENVLSIVGHLPRIAEALHHDWPEFHEYAQQKYPAELDEDLITMIEDLIKTIVLVAEGGVVVSPPMAARLLAAFNLLGEDTGAEKLASLLSKREWEVLILVGQGFTNREIVTTLVISENTVKVHLRTIMEKLHAHTRQQAVSLVGGKDLLPRVTQTDTKQA